MATPPALHLQVPGEKGCGNTARLLLAGLVAALSLEAAVVIADDPGINWNKRFKVPDGRVFVTDGALMLEAELADPAELPGTELPAATGALMARHMAAERALEVELDDLERGDREQTYETPGGLPFSARYVDYLREAVPDGSLRIGGDHEPVVIVDDDGSAVGLVMAMARAKPQTP